MSHDPLCVDYSWTDVHLLQILLVIHRALCYACVLLQTPK